MNHKELPNGYHGRFPKTLKHQFLIAKYSGSRENSASFIDKLLEIIPTKNDLVEIRDISGFATQLTAEENSFSFPEKRKYFGKVFSNKLRSMVSETDDPTSLIGINELYMQGIHGFTTLEQDGSFFTELCKKHDSMKPSERVSLEQIDELTQSIKKAGISISQGKK